MFKYKPSSCGQITPSWSSMPLCPCGQNFQHCPRVKLCLYVHRSLWKIMEIAYQSVFDLQLSWLALFSLDRGVCVCCPQDGQKTCEVYISNTFSKSYKYRVIWLVPLFFLYEKSILKLHRIYTRYLSSISKSNHLKKRKILQRKEYIKGQIHSEDYKGMNLLQNISWKISICYK